MLLSPMRCASSISESGSISPPHRVAGWVHMDDGGTAEIGIAGDREVETIGGLIRAGFDIQRRRARGENKPTDDAENEREQPRPEKDFPLNRASIQAGDTRRASR